ncbi:MAG TPA: DUF2752 domain-containing protein [Nonomuraea sp.]|nr:DUF2752 domain-containing protein [Nonomuraea sp.]
MLPAVTPVRSGGTRAAWAAPLGVLAAGVGAVAVVATVDPEQPGHYPTCPFLSVTGWWCPGCGSLRAVHALAHGDVATAVDRNVLLVLTVPVFLVAWGAWLRRRLTGRPPRAVPVPALWLILATVGAFWVLRNLPAGSWLAP